MKQKGELLILIVGVFVFLYSGNVFSAGSESSRYTLSDFYRHALEHADQIGIAEENVALAENLRTQALSVLKPTVTAFGTYRHYSEEKKQNDATIQPEWEGAYGLKAGQSFTMNGRELTALRITEQGITKSQSDLDAVKEAYLFNVAQAFFAVAKADKAVDIAKANVRRLQAHLEAVTLRLKLAEVSKTELFRTRAELAKADADYIQAENLLRLMHVNLARLTGLETPFDIVEQDTLSLSPHDADVNSLKQRAMAQRADLKSKELQEQIAAKQVDYAKGAYWPRLGVEGAWTRMDQEPDPALDESIYVELGLQWDLFDGGLRRSRVGEARVKQLQAAMARSDARRSIAVEVEQAWLDWQTQQGIIQSLDSQLRYARENFTAVSQLFAHGMANSVDVMDANTVLVTAERQLFDARYNLQLAVLGIEKAIGEYWPRIQKMLQDAPS